MRSWVNQAIETIEADFQRSADTHLIKLALPALKDIDIYLKDESTHPTGSLKHRLARSLFLYGLCNGFIQEGTSIIESSSGSTAVSEAYFARLLGLPFIAVIPESTSSEKIHQIEFYGGSCHKVPAGDIYQAAEDLAKETQGYYMDQFTYAERATDWRSNNNIADSIFQQMQRERFPVPRWVIVSAGTGGTSATIGRYIRYRQHDSQLCVADPENSVFFDYFHTGDTQLRSSQGSCIEGIGRPRVEPSFLPSVIDTMIQVPDEASFACLQILETLIGRKCGGSTGTNLYATFQLAADMQQKGESGSLVSMICDNGDRYLDTYHNDEWLQQKGYQLSHFLEELEGFILYGKMSRIS